MVDALESWNRPREHSGHSEIFDEIPPDDVSSIIWNLSTPDERAAIRNANTMSMNGTDITVIGGPSPNPELPPYGSVGGEPPPGSDPTSPSFGDGVGGSPTADAMAAAALSTKLARKGGTADDMDLAILSRAHSAISRYLL